jgi:GTPase SAR1 family protein
MFILRNFPVISSTSILQFLQFHTIQTLTFVILSITRKLWNSKSIFLNDSIQMFDNVKDITSIMSFVFSCQIQFGSEWRNFDFTEFVLDSVWSSDAIRWKTSTTTQVIFSHSIETFNSLFFQQIFLLVSFWTYKLILSLWRYVFLDTPGQIEVFTWSASGTIITESFASTFPTIFIYIVDTPRCTNPTTFMSNMLYACRSLAFSWSYQHTHIFKTIFFILLTHCVLLNIFSTFSILYKTKLPLLVVFNKTDILKHDFAIEWMKDFDAFEEAIRTSSNYMANFTQSLGLMLEEFYKNLNVQYTSQFCISFLFGIVSENDHTHTMLCNQVCWCFRSHWIGNRWTFQRDSSLCLRIWNVHFKIL